MVVFDLAVDLDGSIALFFLVRVIGLWSLFRVELSQSAR